MAASGRELTAEQDEKLERYLHLLAEANEVMNLTRVTELEQARVLHVADALTLLPYIHADTLTLADVGSGGGVPGIPLAVALPGVKVTLIEATGKKCRFLEEAGSKLGLTNLKVINARAEDAGRNPALRDNVDVVTARAVGALVWLAEWCLPLARKGGKVLAMKGPKLAEELPEAERAMKSLTGGPAKIHPVTLPGTTGHVICEIPKWGKTDPKYPRPATLAKGRPLG